MQLPETVFLISFCISTFILLLMFIKAISGNPIDPSEAKGSTIKGIVYSFTAGMSPLKKETANKHWSTYIAGICYHSGIFLGFFWLFIHVSNISLVSIIYSFSRFIFIISIISGFGILLKRTINKKLRYLSNPDDYISNALVTGFLTVSLLNLYTISLRPVLWYYSAFLFLYIPVGKLKHAAYFILARIYLGLFYGKRGVWPLAKNK